VQPHGQEFDWSHSNSSIIVGLAPTSKACSICVSASSVLTPTFYGLFH
jgi:hypothetical protein